MLFDFAFRNVLRNRRRSFLTALAIFFGALIVGLAQGWINGMLDMFMDNFLIYQTGHVRITTQEYLDRERFIPVDAVMPDAELIRRNVTGLADVASVEERLRFGILLGHGDHTVESLGIGLDFAHSRMDVNGKLVRGALGDETGIYIGQALAEKLNVTLGDELLLATKTSEGGLNGIKLPIQGIFKMGISLYDKKMFFISTANAKRLLKIAHGTTELYVYARKTHQADALAAQINAVLPKGTVAKTYKEQMGSLYSTMATMKIVYLFVEALILFLASFVVINTMMMAIFERMHEIGTLKAIGMSDRELFWNFTLEGALIGAAGGIPGALLGYGIIVIMSITGVNLETLMSTVEMPVEYILYPALSWWAVLAAVVLSVIMPALAAMIPARHAGRLQAAEALRK